MNSRVLSRYRQGDMTQTDFLNEIEQMLASEDTERNSLLEIVEDVNPDVNLPRSLELRVRARINGAPTGEVAQPYLNDSELNQLVRKYLPENLEDVSEATRVVVSPREESASSPAEEYIGVGQILNQRFELLELLGSGGMSEVFKARDLESYGSPIVAVKVLNESFTAMPDSLLALKRETAKSQELAHPNIVNVRDFGVDGKHAYMWMEYLDGPSLHHRLSEVKGKGLPRKEALNYLKGMTEALQYAHARRIVHADFKPGNVMISGNTVDDGQRAKIIDFGISRPAGLPGSEDVDQTIFDPGTFNALTPSYASPEMLEKGDPDPRDDIYALGCIAYEMFTGSHPFMRMSAISARDENLKLTPHKALKRREFKALQHALSFDRSKRSPSAAEFLDEFLSSGLPLLPIAASVTAAVALLYAISGIDPGNIFSGGKSSVIIKDCPTCPEMVVVSAGSFTQGSQEQALDHLQNEGPLRTVNIQQPFAIARYEVTVAEFEEFAYGNQSLDSGGCLVYENGWTLDPRASWRSPGFSQDAQHPVSCVSWHDAQRYVRWLSDQTGQAYRLPSASEWEYVARMPVETGFLSFGSEDICASANTPDETAGDYFPGWRTNACSDNYVHTAPVGSLRPNEAQTFDLLGNVFEWVEDCWNGSYMGAPRDGGAWLEGDCSHRELRGGSWFSQPGIFRASYRNRLPEGTRSASIGFRVVRELPIEG